MLVLPTAPQSIGKVLDTGFKLFSVSFTRIVPLTFLVALLGLLPGLLFPGLHSQDQAAMQAAFSSFMVFMPVFFLAMMWLSATLVYRMGAIMYDMDDSMSMCLMVGLRKMLPLLAAAILFMLAVALGLIALVVPGVILSLSLFFYMPLIVLDNESIVGSLKRSHRLVWGGNWWRTATVFAIPLAIYIALVVILGAALGIFVATGAEPAERQISLTADLLNVLVSTFVTPLFYAVMMAQYHDLKLRKEGGDLEQRLAQKDLVA